MTAEERAREFLKNEDGVLGSTYRIMAAFATILVAEEREACAKIVEEASQRPGSVAEKLAAAIRARA